MELCFLFSYTLSFNECSVEQLGNGNKQEKKGTHICHQMVIIVNVLAYTHVYITFSCFSKSIHMYNMIM